MALLSKLVAAAVTYGFAVLLARIMRIADFGQVAFFLNSAVLLSVFGSLGQQMALVRFVPVFRVQGESQRLSDLIRSAFGLATVGVTLTTLVAISLAIFFKRFGFLPGYSYTAICAGFLMVFCVAWSDFQAHLARGFHRIQLSIIPKEILWRGITALIVMLVFFTQNRLQITAEFAIILLILVLVGLNLAQGFLLLRKNKFLRKPRLRAHLSDPWPSTIVPYWISSLSNIFLANADVVCVGLLIGPTSAAYYFAANRLAMFLVFFMTSYNVVIGPIISEAWGNGQFEIVQATILKATLKSVIPTTVLGIAFVVFAPQFLMIFGSEFTQGTLVLQLLTIAGILNAASGPADIALNMCGFERQAMRISAGTLVFNFLILTGGAVVGGGAGVALAVLIGTVVRKFFFWRAARVHLCIRTDIFAALRKQLPPVAATIA